jgi:hypothetical protein
MHSQVTAHNVLEHRTLSARLAADDDNLGKIDRVVNVDGHEDVLEPVHKPGEVTVSWAQDTAKGQSVKMGRAGRTG